MTITVKKTANFNGQIIEETATVKIRPSQAPHEEIAAFILVMRIALKQKLES